MSTGQEVTAIAAPAANEPFCTNICHIHIYSLGGNINNLKYVLKKVMYEAIVKYTQRRSTAATLIQKQTGFSRGSFNFMNDFPKGGGEEEEEV